MTSELARWRADTPGCAHRNHLNNAGAGLMPTPVLGAMVDHLRLESLAGGYEAANMRAAPIEGVYSALAQLVGASPHNVAIVANATAGFIQSVTSFDLLPGDVIITSRSDYTSYQIQYLALARRLGVRLLHAEDLPEGGIDPDSVRQLIKRSRCRFVHVTWIPTHSGTIQDVEGVGAVCEEFGIPYLVDGCQAIGQLPIDVARLKCDYLSVTARKFLRGPRGIGFLYASDRALARGDHPLFVDMRGATWTADDQYTVADTARRYEDWEFPYALVLGLGAAAQYALQEGVEGTGRRARQLAARLRGKLAALPGVRPLDRGADLSAIVTATVAGRSGPEIVAELGRRSINSAATLGWFGRLDFRDDGATSAVRLAPHYYNTEEEVDAVADAIAELVSK